MGENPVCAKIVFRLVTESVNTEKNTVSPEAVFFLIGYFYQFFKPE